MIPVAEPLDLRRLESFRKEDLDLWNWFSACLPGVSDWLKWTSDVAGRLLSQPGFAKARLVKTNLANTSQPAERIAIESETLVIGRDASNGVVLPEGTITRRHALLRRSGDTYLLEDLGSTMGTLYSGNKLSAGVSIELTHGSEFVIFPHHFKLEIEREWQAQSDVNISQPIRAAGSTVEFLSACPAGWLSFPIQVEPLGARAYMICESAFLDGLVDSMLMPLGRAALGLASSRDAWIELLLLAVMERANRDLAWPLRFALGNRMTAGSTAEEGRGIAIAATLQAGSMRGGLRLMFPFELLENMQRTVPQRRADTIASLASWIFPVTCGSFEITRTEQQSIESGDVVLYQPAPAILFPRSDTTGLEARWIDESKLEVRGKFDRRRIMTETTDVLRDLPLLVEIVVAEREMTLAEAEALAPGSIVDLKRDPRDPVRLAVNGRFIGSGELVDVQGRLGVKILEWSAR